MFVIGILKLLEKGNAGSIIPIPTKGISILNRKPDHINII